MALLQGILALLTRSLGTLFNTAFGWAVVSLFGQMSPREKTVLSILVGAAAAWPLLLLGIVVPKMAAFVIAFVPLSDSIPKEAVRPIWIGLSALVPFGIGIALHYRSGKRRPLWRDALAGVRVTTGLALSFLFTLVSTPLLRVWSMLRKRVDEHVAAIAERHSYEAVAEGLHKGWAEYGIRLNRVSPPLWLAFPTQILKKVGGETFRGYVPERTAFFQGEGLQAASFPNGILLRGTPELVAHAVICAEEILIDLPALQTVDPEAQALERRIHLLWRRFTTESGAAPSQAKELVQNQARMLSRSKLPLRDSQTLYRELLQIGRRFDGEPPLMIVAAEKGNGKERANGEQLSDEHPEAAGAEARSGRHAIL